jgi:hypothetical protein
MSGRLLVTACVIAAIAGVLGPAVAATHAEEMAGMHPMPGDKPVPEGWLPPGAMEPDTGPSSVVYPPQKITLRFNHKKHVKELKAKCTVCHGKVTASQSAQDVLLPAGTACDTCHDTDHSDPKHVKPGSDEMGQCAFCHLGYSASSGNHVAKLDMPRANMNFNHKAHLDHNVQCGQCHGSVDQLELATRDQLPRMKGCFGCHQMTGAAQGKAKSTCETCHLREPDGTMQTMFASGELKPPRWLANAEHTPDWIERHKRVAGDDGQLCATCHSERYCTDCHDGKVRPRNVHPNDWISMHPMAARQDNPRCTSCHNEQTFCLMCHQRLGVVMSGPNSGKTGGTFHPVGWLGGIAGMASGRGPGAHSWEAQRNLNACVSCHTERDCTSCHAAVGHGGTGINPHPPSFASSCATQYRRNARPCLVCHDIMSNEIGGCR